MRKKRKKNRPHFHLPAFHLIASVKIVKRKNSEKERIMNEKLLDILTCPICQGRLKYHKENNQLICTFKQVAYPIENGIPVLLAERAIPLNPTENAQ